MTDWNKKLTNLIRQNDGTLWGNWSMVAQVNLGDYGVINPETAEFTRLGNITELYPDLFKTGSKSTGDFFYKTSGVQKHSVTEKISGEFLEPDTETIISGGIKFSWNFSQSNDMLVNFTAVRSDGLMPVQNLLRVDVFKTLLQAAGTAGKRSNSGGILPGFVVVTDVVKSAGGFMVASESSNQKFSIGGEAKATSALVEGLTGDVKAGYSFTESTDSIVKYIFPSPNKAVMRSEQAPQAHIAFRALSFNDKALLTNWKG